MASDSMERQGADSVRARAKDFALYLVNSLEWETPAAELGSEVQRTSALEFELERGAEPPEVDRVQPVTDLFVIALQQECVPCFAVDLELATGAVQTAAHLVRGTESAVDFAVQDCMGLLVVLSPSDCAHRLWEWIDQCHRASGCVSRLPWRRTE